MPELFEHPCSVAHRRCDLRVDGFAVRRIRRKGDPQPAGRTRDLLQIGSLRRGRGIGARRLRPLKRIEHRRAVADADAHDMTHRKARPALAAIRARRRARPRRLQAEHAAGRGRNADRSATVAGVSHRHNPCGNRRRCAARRSAGRVFKIPRIARRPMQPRLGRRHQPEFGTGALAVNNETSIDETLRDGAGVAGYEIAIDVGAEGGASAFDQVEVFQ